MAALGRASRSLGEREETKVRNKRATVLSILSGTVERGAGSPSERGTCKCDVKGHANNNVWTSRSSFRLAEASSANRGCCIKPSVINTTY